MKSSYSTRSLGIVALSFTLLVLPNLADAATHDVRLLQPESWPGGPRNSVYDVAVSGQHVFVALGTAGIGVINISDPTHAVYMGGSSNVGAAYRLVIQDNFLYVAGRASGFHIVDISNPARLVRVGGTNTGANVQAVTTQANYAYFGTTYAGLEIFDISDPRNSWRVGGIPIGNAYSIAVSGGRAYFWDSGGLQIIDVSNPANCTVLGVFSSDPGSALAAAGNIVYQSIGLNGLRVVDTTDPTNCLPVATIGPIERSAWRARIFGNRLYLEEHSVNLHIFDISNPTNLIRLGGISRPGLNDGVAVSGDYAFLGNFYEGLDVLDISEPIDYRRVYQVGIGGDAHDIAAHGKYTLLADGQPGLRILQTASEGNLTQAGNYAEVGFATCVTASDQLAYVGVRNGGGQNGLRIVDVSNPTNCSLIGSCIANWVGNKVAVTNGFAYAASSHGLQVINVQNPNSCTIIRSGIITSPASDLQLADNHLYLAGYQGLHIVNISNPTNATRIGGWKWSNTNLTYPALSVSWPYVHLASGDEGFNIIHVANPANCVRVGGYVDASFPVNDVALLGHYALLLNSARREVRVFDVSNPTNCTFVTSLETVGPTKNINVINGEVFFANGLEGLAGIPSIPDIHKTLRIDSTPNLPFTLEAATNLSDPNSWQPLLTTNVAAMPFDFVDFDVKVANKPQKFYRVRQP